METINNKETQVVMKNKKTGQYWTDSIFPPLTNNVWNAMRFNSVKEAQSAINALLGEKFSPSEFSPVVLSITEKDV